MGVIRRRRGRRIVWELNTESNNAKKSPNSTTAPTPSQNQSQPSCSASLRAWTNLPQTTSGTGSSGWQISTSTPRSPMTTTRCSCQSFSRLILRSRIQRNSWLSSSLIWKRKPRIWSLMTRGCFIKRFSWRRPTRRWARSFKTRSSSSCCFESGHFTNRSSTRTTYALNWSCGQRQGKRTWLIFLPWLVSRKMTKLSSTTFWKRDWRTILLSWSCSR